MMKLVGVLNVHLQPVAVRNRITYMKKTDFAKYLAMGMSIASMPALAFGYPMIAALIAVPSTFIVALSRHKSGGLFSLALFASITAVGVATDFPFSHVPATLFSLYFICISMQLRTWFFERLLLYKALPLEMVLIFFFAVCFVIAGTYADYTWWQWLSGALPVTLFTVLSVFIYHDRNTSRKEVAKMTAKLGRKAPDFTLNDQNGRAVSLKEVLATQHALLIFVRGDWCPTCHMMLRSYIKNKEKLSAKNVKVIGIGPDPIGVNKEIMGRIDENSLMLADDNQEIAGLYSMSLQENNPITKSMYRNGIPLPASFLVHRNGTIVFTSSSDKAAEILQPDKIFEAIAKIER